VEHLKMTAIADTGIGHLQSLCAGLCRDADIRVRESPGNSWFFTPATRTITVGADDLKKAGPEYCAGVMAHEVGHVFISRYHNLPMEFESSVILKDFLNGIEDPRVNTWIKKRYPGAKAWQERMRDQDVTPIQSVMPYCFLFALESAREEYINWQPADSVGPVPNRVMAELNKTRDARKRYAETLPSSNLVPALSLGETRTRYDQIIKPIYEEEKLAPFPDHWEQTVRLSQHEAMEVAARDLLPSLTALLEIDLGRIADFIESKPGGQALALSALRAGNGIGQFLAEALRHNAEIDIFQPAVGKTRRLALRILTETAKCQSGKPGQAGKPMQSETNQSPPPQSRSAPPPQPIQRVELPAPKSIYEKTRLALNTQIEALSSMLEELFQPKRRLREKTGLPQGEKIDLRKLVAFEADPKLYRQLWRRKTIPDRRTFAIYVLMDLSQSMSKNGKIQAAFGGMVLLAEVLHRHQVDFAISGFQEELIPFHNFGVPFNSDSRLKLEEMIPTVESGRNHDGPCLLEASKTLAAQPATDRLLIAISDGEPSGPGGEDNASRELKIAIAEISSTTPPIELVGLGLGVGTEFVSDFYPKSKSCIPESELASEIAGVIMSALVG